MSTAALERELIRWRSGGDAPGGENVQRLTVPEALALRAAGNLPDELGRTLRLVLRVDSEEDLRSLHSKRLLFEPDYHDAPTWRREGSRPINVVPLRSPEIRGTAQPWWEDDRTGALEEEWERTGAVAGMKVPAGVRSFVFKTILSLRDAERDVSPAAVGASIARWLPPDEAHAIEAALREANR